MSIRVWFEALFGRWSILRHLGFDQFPFFDIVDLFCMARRHLPLWEDCSPCGVAAAGAAALWEEPIPLCEGSIPLGETYPCGRGLSLWRRIILVEKTSSCGRDLFAWKRIILMGGLFLWRRIWSNCFILGMKSPLYIRFKRFPENKNGSEILKNRYSDNI